MSMANNLLVRGCCNSLQVLEPLLAELHALNTALHNQQPDPAKTAKLGLMLRQVAALQNAMLAKYGAAHPITQQLAMLAADLVSCQHHQAAGHAATASGTSRSSVTDEQGAPADMANAQSSSDFTFDSPTKKRAGAAVRNAAALRLSSPAALGLH